MESAQDHPPVEALSSRELSILRLLTEGLSDREIARQLTLALETVKWYNKQIYGKLGVRNRTEAASYANAQGLLNGAVEAGTSPPAASSAQPTHALPAMITSFVGRQHEIEEVCSLLEDVRLLTLTGLAGCGKTRLALQVARRMLSQFSDGVYFVPLAPVASVDNLLWVIAERLNLQFFPRPEPLEQLEDYLRKKTLLLVLDNFEHLLDGAEIVARILQAAPSVRILVTSRERLRLYGEVNYTIAGLSLGDRQTSYHPRSEAVELFEQRMRSVAPDLEVDAEALRQIERICQQVEGMPLGIELAATWMDVLSPQEIASEIESSLDILQAELRDLPDSQRSMRASFARSWNLLNESQKTAFQRLSIFRGGFTRQTATAVTGVELRTLQALVNKSLLHYAPDTGRYEIHELLRHYAQEQLDSSGEAAAAYEAHARYFADFMAERWTQLKGHQQKVALLEVENDIENVRAAWDYWTQLGSVGELRKFLHTFWVVYDIRGWYPAGIQLFERAVEVVRQVTTDEAQAVLGWLLAVQGVYYLSGGIYRSVGGAQKGFILAQEGVQIVEHLHDYDEMMLVPLICLFLTASQVNDMNIAVSAAQDCLEIASQIGDEWAIAKAKQFLTIRSILESDYPTAERLSRDALSTFEKNGDKWSASALSIEVMSLMALNQRQFDKATEWIERGLRAAQEIDFKYSQQMAYWQLGFVATLQNDYSRAAKYWNKAMELGEAAVGSPVLMGFNGTSNSGEWGGRKLIDP